MALVAVGILSQFLLLGGKQLSASFLQRLSGFILRPDNTLVLGIHRFSKFDRAAVFCDRWPFRFTARFGAICGSALYSRRSVTVGRRAGRSLYSGVCISIFCQCLLYWLFFCVIFSSSLLFIYWGWSSTAFTSTVFGFYPVAVLCSRLHLSH